MVKSKFMFNHVYRLQPKLIGGRGAQETKNVFAAHFRQQKATYGDQVFILKINLGHSNADWADVTTS